MRLPKRDVIATVLVAAAGLLYALWASDAAPPGLDSVRSTGVVILALGFAASASAVVPGFEELLHGNRAYVAVTSLIGLVAFVAGLQALIGASETGLGVLMVAMVVLWAIATVHHALLGKQAPAVGPPRRGRPAAAAR